MEWQRIEILKEKLQKEDDFQGVWQYFFDHLAGNQAFIACGENAKPDILEVITPTIEKAVSHIVRQPVSVVESNISEVPSHHFFHGPMAMSAGICIVMYFDDIKAGMMSFTRGLETGQMHYGRFTTLPFDTGNSVVLPTHNQTGH
jgi:hypothetical protein